MPGISAEGLRQQRPEDLTGRHVDTAALLAKIAPRLEARDENLLTFIANDLARMAEVTSKIHRYGERTPSAPFLSELTFRLEQALLDPMAYSDGELLQLYGHWQLEIQEARDFFDE